MGTDHSPTGMCYMRTCRQLVPDLLTGGAPRGFVEVALSPVVPVRLLLLKAQLQPITFESRCREKVGRGLRGPPSINGMVTAVFSRVTTPLCRDDEHLG